MKNRIKDLREDRDLLQKDIALFLNITIRQYRRIEKGENELSYNSLIKLSEFYNTSVDYILGIINNIEPYPKNKSYNKIKDLRIENNLYQKDVAKVLNITQPDYSVIESNKNELSYDGLIKLSKFYNTSIDYILGLTDDKKPYTKEAT